MAWRCCLRHDAMSWAALAALSSVATALFVLFGGAATKHMSSATMNAIQATAMLVTTLSVASVSGSTSFGEIGDALKSQGLLLAVIAGVFSGVAWIAFFAAESLATESQTGSAARVAAINATYIVLLAIIEPLFRSGPTVTLSQGVGILLVLTGNVLVLLPR